MWRRMVRGLTLGILGFLLIPSAFAQNFIGSIEKPREGETVFGMVLVQGFALDEGQISGIDLYVDGVFQHTLGNTHIPRLDLIEAYPNYHGIHEKVPGFQTGFLASRFPNGAHTIHLQVRMSDGRVIMIGPRVVEIDNTINQSPFGFIDIPGHTGVHDASGSFPVTGWATDTDGVKRIDVLIDGLNMQSAVYGDVRPDVHNAYPDLPAALFSGWIAHVDTTRLINGIHHLAVRVTDNLGMTKVIGERTVQIFNSTHLLRPFGYLEEPQKDATLYGTNCGVAPSCQISPCAPVSFANHITPVRGWALDLGSREDLGRVAYAELMIDGVAWITTDHCRFNPTLGAFTNCYGLPRLDVARFYPTYNDSPRSGFFFTLDVGSLMALGVNPGHHVLKVRVGDQEQTFAELPNTSGVNVFFTCVEDTFDFPSLGFIEYPTRLEYLKGTVTFSGWALDENSGVRTVEIWVDGVFMGPAAYGLARPDVQQVFPMLPQAAQSGWRFTLDTTQLSDARHRLVVKVIDSGGRETIIGSTDFYVDNPN